MGCVGSKQEDRADPPALLLLGPHGAGKTTLLRHAEIATGVYGHKNTREGAGRLIRSIVVGYAALVAQQLVDCSVVDPDSVSAALVAEALKLAKAAHGDLTPELARGFAHLVLETDAVDTLARNGARSVSSDLLELVVGVAGRAADPLYVPTDEDVLGLQWTTVGVHERSLELELNRTPTTVRVVDMGGRFQERAKWRSILSTSFPPPASQVVIVFVAALDGFDCQMTECPERNAMLESLELLGRVSSDYPQYSLAIVLTKEDKFRELYRAREREFSRLFPSFWGANVDEALSFVSESFKNRADGRAISCVTTNAADPKAPDALVALLAAGQPRFMSLPGTGDLRHRRMDSGSTTTTATATATAQTGDGRRTTKP